MDNGEKVCSSFRNFCFRNRVVSKMIGAAYGLSMKRRTEFYVIFKNFEISRLSLYFFEAKYGWTYGREWLIYVELFCVLLLEI